MEKRITRLDFLNNDGSVAFSLDNNHKIGYSHKGRDTRAFIQGGSLSVSLQNGMRRKANITLANLDNAFSFNINNLWFGQRVKLWLGAEYSNGQKELYPQGVFYITNPRVQWNPKTRTVAYDLVDKWAYLDGTLFGTLEGTYQVPLTGSDGEPTNIFDAMHSVLKIRRDTFQSDTNNEVPLLQVDNVTPVFTVFYNDRTYLLENGDDVPVLQLPYTINTSAESGTLANIILELNTIIAGYIGYDCNGALRVEPSQDDLSDTSKPILWNFTPENSVLLGLSESVKDTEVYNDILITSTSVNNSDVWGRATNYDPKSDTNVNIIGRKTYRESKTSYWSSEQCVALAQYMLKQKTILQKSVTIECAPLYTLLENRLVTVKRTDKPGSPVERHLITGYTLPISETGTMTVNCTSVNDLNVLATVSATNLFSFNYYQTYKFPPANQNSLTVANGVISATGTSLEPQDEFVAISSPKILFTLGAGTYYFNVQNLPANPIIDFKIKIVGSVERIINNGEYFTLQSKVPAFLFAQEVGQGEYNYSNLLPYLISYNI